MSESLKISFYTLQLGNQPIVHGNIKFADYLLAKAFPNAKIQFVAHEIEDSWRDIDGRDSEVILLRSRKIMEKIRDFRKYLLEDRPDIVFASGPIMGAVSIFSKLSLGSKAKIVLHLHNVTSIYMGKQKTIFDRRGIRVFFKLFSKRLFRIICVSKGVSRDFCEWIGVKCDNIITIYNPVRTRCEVDHLKATSPHAWLEHKELPVIVMVNRLSYEKDIATSLRSIGALTDRMKVRLIVVGKGDLLDELKSLAAELGISDYVDFYGFSSNPFYFFDRADLFLISSIYEGFGNVIVEAMSSGCPVVATDCPGGPREILDNGKYGELVPVGDSAALAAAIERSLSREHDTEALRVRAKEFSIDVQGRIFEKVVVDALSDR